MKKVLLVVAMLLAASQVMAGVTITAVNEGTYALPDGNRAATIRVDYAGDINVRAFALDINVDSGCNFWSIRNFKVGENNGTNNGYGIFPGRFRQFINPIAPAWGDANGNSNYNPTPPWADPGTTNTGIGWATMIVEMGYLGAGDVNKPAQSGTLFRADVNAYAFVGTAHVTITANAMRGGVVDKDTNATTAAVTYVPADVCFPCVAISIPVVVGDNMTDANTALAAFTTIVIGYECNNTYAAGLVCRQDTGSQCPGVPVHYWVSTGPCCTTILNEVGQLKATAETAWTGQGFSVSGIAVVDCAHLGVVIDQNTGCVTLPYTVKYHYGVAPAEPNVVGMTRANAKAALNALGFVVGASSTDVNGWGGAGVSTVGNVFVQNPAAGTTGCGTTVILSVVSYPIKDTAITNAMYANWVLRSKPQCWAYPRQCHGDADGKKLGAQWVSNNDLIILKSAIAKAETLIPAGGICADFDHKKLGAQWVSNNDLIILKAYIAKAETLIPICGNTSVITDPNFWYWCIPTGVTCPTGQVCAPAGTCPNTP